ncbi:ribosome biogenesis protein tsr1 [Thecamonas trahens ATCC 50062]|uniref:Ribosome biogenesis protein tsr1 n=1 Tax=Thecamonas trahens ATCC 50062 TaxID=461836 RepID=A0A0L0D193_THETB|nr:ribosome biogenesis protein tsr1 [Thecamonas trahens ATCC 50062]KNC45900.1 ribosome biogenesis protein tsr1 [Thecamonas trahens ATCC 50062]|eukprot:XP_013762888.1 ribosome biogenesis protein tsr1 [Thecamonas trahens ATCC 50062]
MSGHRPTLKHVHKPFKSSHRTKSAIKRASSSLKNMTRNSVRSGTGSLAADYKANRRNASAQARKAKKAKNAVTKRAGTVSGPPRVVLLLPLSPEPGVGTLDLLTALLGPSVQGPDVLKTALPVLGAPVTVTYEALKARITYIVAPTESPIELLDALRAADVVVPVVDALVGVDDDAQLLVSMMLAQGMPTALPVLRNLELVGGPAKNKSKTRKAFNRFISSKLGPDVSFHVLDSDAAGIRFLQLLSKSKLRRIQWRDARPYLMAEAVAYDDASRKLRISGYLRGSPLSPNQLVHLPGKGTYRISAIYEAPDPVPLNRAQARMSAEPMAGSAEGYALLATADEAKLHPMEQLLPPEVNEEEDELAARMADFDDDDGGLPDPFGDSGSDDGRPGLHSASRGAKAIDHINVVRAEIQSDWEAFVGLGPANDSDNDDGEGVGAGAGAAGGSDASGSDGESDDDERPLNPVEALAARQAEDFEWPDEFYAPRAPLCKDLFREYRGLKSFTNSPWDPYENLPTEYSQIYDFESFPRTQNEVLDEVENDGVGLDAYIVIELDDVPPSVMASLTPTGVLVAFGLFRYERQFSVLHMSVSRHASFDAPHASGSPLMVMVGFRMLEAAPLFSSDNPKCAKAKFERFLQPGRTLTASIYGPIVFGPSMPVFMFRLNADSPVPQLVATGSVASINPQKLIIKRIVLIGEPFHIHKSRATVRRMFYSPEDIRYFKKIECYTKYGRRGHITDSIGTHGYMKMQFDGVLDARDTICLPLFTRLFPRNNTRIIDADTVLEPQDQVIEATALSQY